MKTRMNKREHGVALLFALGLLALMSVFGVAFVANSLNAQKVAVNVGARNQSLILMDTAINRIMATLMAVLLQSPSGAADYSCIFSTPNGAARMEDGTTWDQLDEQKKGDRIIRSSRLSVQLAGYPKYAGGTSKASWIYLKDNDGQIIGRMAYQVLPNGRSSMSLDQVLLGIYNHDKAAGGNFGAPGKLDVEHPVLDSNSEPKHVHSPWDVRIGKDIREFNIGKAHGSNAPFEKEWRYGDENDSDNKYRAAQFPEKIYDGGEFSEASPFRVVETFDGFFGGVMFTNLIAGSSNETNENRKKWLRHWFTESNAAAPEVFYGTNAVTNERISLESAIPYHRFNLSDIENLLPGSDSWYSRFKINENKKNGQEVIDLLFRESKEFLQDDTVTPAGSGINYLRVIGKSQGSFENLKLRREQIAANLNDYCDGDSIPTSNKDPKNWAPGENAPDFTGNEKTPYINEFVFGALFKDLKMTNNQSLQFKLFPQLVTEVIDIYGGATQDYYLKSWLSKFKINADVLLKGKVKYTSGEETKEFDFDYTDNVSDTVAIESGDGNIVCEMSDGTNSVQSFPDAFESGYCVAVTQPQNSVEVKIRQGGAVDFSQLSTNPSIDFKTKLNDFLKTRDASADTANATYTITGIKVAIKNLSFKFDASGLFGKNDNIGVDFVKGPDNEIQSADGNAELEFNVSGTNVTFNTKSYNTVYFGGMEVRDPRQNLNFKSANTANIAFKTAATDWKCVPGEPVWATPAETNIVNATLNRGSDEKFKGAVNSCSNPAAPFSAEDPWEGINAGECGVDYDKETVTNPAWLGEASGAHLSTAYIRNAPMQSLWELGVIHRASAWETINIKRAYSETSGSARRVELYDNAYSSQLDKPGVAYERGDAGILDQVKLTSRAYSSGKLDVNMLLEDPNKYDLPAEWNKNIAKALLYNIAIGQQVGDLYKADKICSTGNAIDWTIDSAANSLINNAPNRSDSGHPDKNRYVSRADFVEGKKTPTRLRTSPFLANGFGIISNWNDLPDAQQEELVGKTVNLLTCGATAPKTIQAVVVVQMIRSIPRPLDNPIEIVKTSYKKNGETFTSEISLEKDSPFQAVPFSDSDGGTSYTYFDEIIGESRALITIKHVKNSDGTGERFQLYNIKYF